MLSWFTQEEKQNISFSVTSVSGFSAAKLTPKTGHLGQYAGAVVGNG